MPDPLLLDLVAALGQAHITSGQIRTPRKRSPYTILGLCEGKQITINEAQLLLPVILHELTHYVRPHWTERGVERATQRLLRSLSDDDVEHLYRLYRAAKRRHRKSALVTDA